MQPQSINMKSRLKDLLLQDSSPADAEPLVLTPPNAMAQMFKNFFQPEVSEQQDHLKTFDEPS